jgi:hypothetical protein
MGNFKYKIKEAGEILKPTEVDPALIQRIEKTYGPVDMKNDFFSANLKTYFKTSSVNPESGSVGHRIIKLASFTDVLEKLYSSTTALSDLVASPGGKDDSVVVKLYDDLKTIFNSFRSHLRKYYPDQYEAIKNKLDEMSKSKPGKYFCADRKFKWYQGYKGVLPQILETVLVQRKKVRQEMAIKKQNKQNTCIFLSKNNDF